MEIAFLVVAVLGLLALSGSASAISTVAPQVQEGVTQNPIPSTWTPSVPSPAQVPMVPSTSANVGAPLLSGAAQIGTQVSTQALQQSGAIAGIGLTAATAGIAAGVGVLVGIASSLLAAHAARLKGATNENNAVDTYIPVFDSFIQQLVAAYNSGQCTAAQAAQACQQFDQYIYQAFRRLVGAPGTAWNDTIGMGGQCNSGCTVGCCIYFGDLGPPLNDISYVLGFPTSKWGRGDPRINGRTVTVPKVYPSKYSSFTRALYTVTLK